MKKSILSTFIFFLITLATVAQLSEGRMAWTSNPLTWQDFKGAPDLSSPFHANTSSGISYSWSMKRTGEEIEVVYEVDSYFIPEQSWVKPGKDSQHLLVHEQLHFDITELHARKLKKAMLEFDFKKSGNIKPELQAIYKTTEAERYDMQKRFDAETRHSMDSEAQLKWQKFVEEELQKLEKFDL